MDQTNDLDFLTDKPAPPVDEREAGVESAPEPKSPSLADRSVELNRTIQRLGDELKAAQAELVDVNQRLTAPEVRKPLHILNQESFEIDQRLRQEREAALSRLGLPASLLTPKIKRRPHPPAAGQKV